MSPLDLLRSRAHLLLGAIRLFNGAAALTVPELSARRLGTDPDASPAPLYPLRMFGVRTVVLGAELLLGDEETRLRSMRIGRFIHASDTLAAALGGVRRQLPARVAVPLTAVSTLNTVLAFLGSSPPRPAARRLLRR
jgi:hypothetical protein